MTTKSVDGLELVDELRGCRRSRPTSCTVTRSRASVLSRMTPASPTPRWKQTSCVAGHLRELQLQQPPRRRRRRPAAPRVERLQLGAAPSRPSRMRLGRLELRAAASLQLRSPPAPRALAAGTDRDSGSDRQRQHHDVDARRRSARRADPRHGARASTRRQRGRVSHRIASRGDAARRRLAGGGCRRSRPAAGAGAVGRAAGRSSPGAPIERAVFDGHVRRDSTPRNAPVSSSASMKASRSSTRREITVTATHHPAVIVGLRLHGGDADVGRQRRLEPVEQLGPREGPPHRSADWLRRPPLARRRSRPWSTMSGESRGVCSRSDAVALGPSARTWSPASRSAATGMTHCDVEQRSRPRRERGRRRRARRGPRARCRTAASRGCRAAC